MSILLSFLPVRSTEFTKEEITPLIWFAVVFILAAVVFYYGIKRSGGK